MIFKKENTQNLEQMVKKGGKAVGNFLKNAFSDMKESAKAQHEVDKANFEAIKAESKAQFLEAKAIGNTKKRKAIIKKEQDSQIAAANERKTAAQKKIDELNK